MKAVSLFEKNYDNRPVRLLGVTLSSLKEKKEVLQQMSIFDLNINRKTTTEIINDLKISYVSQSTDNLKGKLKLFAKENNVDESIFKAMLIKMGLSQNDFDTNIQDMSEGQKKKVLIAKSISEQANIYVWDEPLNYIDIITREQIEDTILKYNPTIIFVEHDERFIEKIATKIIKLEK